MIEYSWEILMVLFGGLFVVGIIASILPSLSGWRESGLMQLNGVDNVDKTPPKWGKELRSGTGTMK